VLTPLSVDAIEALIAASFVLHLAQSHNKLSTTEDASGYDGLGPGAVANGDEPGWGWLVLRVLVYAALFTLCILAGFIAGAHFG
jgi:hypothetical protein